MAQITGNTIYITAAEQISTTKTEVRYIFLSPTVGAVAPRVILTDTGGAKTVKLDLVVGTTETGFFDISRNPVRFPNGVNVLSITDCTATLVTTSQGG